MRSEKENTVFTELDDRQVKHYYQDKSESFFQVNGVEFVLTLSHYCQKLAGGGGGEGRWKTGEGHRFLNPSRTEGYEKMAAKE